MLKKTEKKHESVFIKRILVAAESERHTFTKT